MCMVHINMRNAWEKENLDRNEGHFKNLTMILNK